MGNRADEIAAYEKAAFIADKLLAAGLPLIAFSDSDMGAKCAFAFQLQNQKAAYGVRLPVDEATVERVRELYEAVA